MSEREARFKGPWLCFCDGAARGNPGPAAAAFVGFDAEGNLIGKEKRSLGKATNNEAEYRAILLCLDFLEKERWRRTDRKGVIIFSDSQLVVNQLNGMYKVKNINMQGLVMEAKQKEKSLRMGVSYILVPREVNFWADRMVNEELDGE